MFVYVFLSKSVLIWPLVSFIFFCVFLLQDIGECCFVAVEVIRLNDFFKGLNLIAKNIFSQHLEGGARFKRVNINENFIF